MEDKRKLHIVIEKSNNYLLLKHDPIVHEPLRQGHRVLQQNFSVLCPVQQQQVLIFEAN